MTSKAQLRADLLGGDQWKRIQYSGGAAHTSSGFYNVG